MKGNTASMPALDRATGGAATRPLALALMIESVGLGGAEMVVLQLAEELRSRGHTVHPVVPLGREGWLLDRFRDAGFAWETYDLRRPIDPGLPKRMAAMLARLGVDAVHSHEFVMAVYGAPAARRLGVPHVVTMHGNQVMMDRFRRRVALKWALKRSTATVAVSEDTRRHLTTTLGLPDDLVRVIHNGIPVPAGERDRMRRELGVAANELLLLAVGSLVERKGHAVLIDAMTLLSREKPARAWQVVIAGQGEERTRLEDRIREAGLGGRIRLLGPREDVADLQAAADIFVMPSLWEGLPLAILEAMFAGNAIVASRTSGIPEAIDDGDHGLLVPPGDASTLAGALRRVMDDAPFRAALGVAARERALARHTIGAMADAYERLYRAGPRLKHAPTPAGDS